MKLGLHTEEMMKLSRCPAGVAVAMLYVVMTAFVDESFAFAPVTQQGRGYPLSVLKGATMSKPELIVANAKEMKGAGGTKKKSAKKAKKRALSKKGATRSKVNGKEGITAKSFKPLKDLKLGSKVSGTVVDVCDFGAFVNIGYATRGSRSGTALLHISQIQDKKIANTRDVMKVGDFIEGARVIKIDMNKGEVGLSLRRRRPKRRDFTDIKVGDALEGRVSSVVSYGVFVDVAANVNALLHISRITGGAIENVRHHLNEGDPVSVHVIDIDQEKKTMAVSMLDKKADQYLDRRMSQRLKRFYGTASSDTNSLDTEEENSDLDYFDQAIRELEEALRDRVN